MKSAITTIASLIVFAGITVSCSRSTDEQCVIFSHSEGPRIGVGDECEEAATEEAARRAAYEAQRAAEHQAAVEARRATEQQATAEARRTAEQQADQPTAVADEQAMTVTEYARWCVESLERAQYDIAYVNSWSSLYDMLGKYRKEMADNSSIVPGILKEFHEDDIEAYDIVLDDIRRSQISGEDFTAVNVNSIIMKIYLDRRGAWFTLPISVTVEMERAGCVPP